MKELIKGKEEWMYHLTNHQVEKIKEQLDTGRSYELVKVLYEHIDTYKTIIDNLLENETKDK